MSKLPEIIFSSSDASFSRQLKSLKEKGMIRKLIPKVYTSNMENTDESIIVRNKWKLIAHFFPEAIISHRTAIEFNQSPNDNIYITSKQRRVHQWPGLTIRISKGPKALEDDNPIYEQLYVSSLERACLENLSSSRVTDGEKKTLDQSIIEKRLLDILNTKGEQSINEFRDRARVIAETFQWNKAFIKLDKLIGALLSTKPSSILTSPSAIARAFGEPYDTDRLALFESLLAKLHSLTFASRKEKTKSKDQFNQTAFFESYFSNYIEGTTFLVEEAKEIVMEGKLIANRPLDSHDIIGTYNVCSSRKEMSTKAANGDEFIQLLRSRHSTILGKRTDKNPGVFKSIANRAGASVFVNPELVIGTLKQGFTLIGQLREPLARAIYMMFLISEVHPFDDGNGRLARVMMNAELVHAEESKLIIPTVYRDDYILNLKRLTRKREADGFIKMMDYAHEFTHTLEPNGLDNLQAQLEEYNSFLESSEAVLKFK